MLTLKQILLSRTMQVLAFTMIYNGVESIHAYLDMLDVHIFPVVNYLLIALAGYFHMNPKQGIAANIAAKIETTKEAQL